MTRLPSTPISDIEPGVHVVTLRTIGEPKTIFPKTGVNAGKEMEILEWMFLLQDGTELQASTSTFHGPKSRLYQWLTALNNGKAPWPGRDPDEDFDTDVFNNHQALATVEINEGGYPRITALTAMPIVMQQAAFAQAAGLPVQAPAANVSPIRAPRAAPAAAAPVAAEPVVHNDELPF